VAPVTEYDLPAPCCLCCAPGVRPKINAALLLLGALASRGAPAAAALVGALDWSLSALTKLARPPRLEAGERARPGSCLGCVVSNQKQHQQQ
jgi:hypothetical protein